jgi:hypothetical protein
MADFLIRIENDGLFDRNVLTGLNREERIMIMNNFVATGFALPLYEEAKMLNRASANKTKAPRLIFGSQFQSTILEHCELGERLLSLLEESNLEEELRIRNILLRVVEEGKIYWLGFSDLPLEEKKLLADVLVKADLMTYEPDPYGIVYAVSFKNMGQRKHSCFLHGTPEGTRNLYLKSLRDASALANSWSLNHATPTYIDRLYMADGELRMEEVDILQNDYRGKPWISSPAPLEQSEVVTVQI